MQWLFFSAFPVDGICAFVTHWLALGPDMTWLCWRLNLKVAALELLDIGAHLDLDLIALGLGCECTYAFVSVQEWSKVHLLAWAQVISHS